MKKDFWISFSRRSTFLQNSVWEIGITIWDGLIQVSEFWLTIQICLNHWYLACLGLCQMNRFFMPGGLTVAWLWAYLLQKTGCVVRASCRKQEQRVWVFLLLLHHILMKRYRNPHRTGRKHRKLGYRAIELDQTITIKSRALGHRKGKWFAQSHRGSMFQVKGLKTGAQILSYSSFTARTSEFWSQTTSCLFSHSLSLSLSSCTCYLFVLFYVTLKKKKTTQQ